jgi:hypothetical protein
MADFTVVNEGTLGVLERKTREIIRALERPQ